MVQMVVALPTNVCHDRTILSLLARKHKKSQDLKDYTKSKLHLNLQTFTMETVTSGTHQTWHLCTGKNPICRQTLLSTLWNFHSANFLCNITFTITTIIEWKMQCMLSSVHIQIIFFCIENVPCLMSSRGHQIHRKGL
jgi:hypothetical protein